MYKNKEKSTKLSQQSYNSFTDEELIFKIAEENQLAFKELFVRYALKVKFLMLKMGTKELDAEAKNVETETAETAKDVTPKPEVNAEPEVRIKPEKDKA